MAHARVHAGSIWPCPALEQLTVGCCDATAAIHAVSSQLRRRTRLTSLLLNGHFAELDPPAWASFFGALAALPALRRVRLRPYHAASQGLTSRLTEALRTFRGLTELSLQGGRWQDGGEMPVLRCDIFAQGLRAVTALRMLGLHDVGLVVPGELWRALRGLSLLQELRVSFCQVRCPPSFSPARLGGPFVREDGQEAPFGVAQACGGADVCGGGVTVLSFILDVCIDAALALSCHLRRHLCGLL